METVSSVYRLVDRAHDLLHAVFVQVSRTVGACTEIVVPVLTGLGLWINNLHSELYNQLCIIYHPLITHTHTCTLITPINFKSQLNTFLRDQNVEMTLVTSWPGWCLIRK